MKMRKIHKYVGWGVLPFLLLMVVSGILLNHRSWISEYEVSRKWLPDAYAYHNWNLGFFKGGVLWGNDDALLYGNEGCWLTDRRSKLVEAGRGLPSTGDGKKILRIVRGAGGWVYALTPVGLFAAHDDGESEPMWKDMNLNFGDESPSDMEVKGEEVVVMTRSTCLVSTATPAMGMSFKEIHLADSSARTKGRSLFSWVWDLHSGALWGTMGRIIVDVVGGLFLFVGMTGIWFGWLKRQKKRTNKTRMRRLFRLHDKWGYALLLPFLIVTLSGAFLRPPLLGLLGGKMVDERKGVEPWHDRLRVLRYDARAGEWLIYTTDGMFTTPALDKEAITAKMRRVTIPPVSVMGLTVLEPLGGGQWVVGSFSGLFLWNRERGTWSSLLPERHNGMPSWMPPMPKVFSGNKVTGLFFMSKDKTVVFDYERGAEIIGGDSTFFTMPAELKHRGMSLWNVALEVHTGRIFVWMEPLTIIVPFLVGLALCMALLSGWRITHLKCFLRKCGGRKC